MNDVDSVTDLEFPDNNPICASITDAMNEHEKEVWQELFDIVDVGEAGISNLATTGISAT